MALLLLSIAVTCITHGIARLIDFFRRMERVSEPDVRRLLEAQVCQRCGRLQWAENGEYHHALDGCTVIEGDLVVRYVDVAVGVMRVEMGR